MKAIHRKRLLKLADFLDKLPPRLFDFERVMCVDGNLPLEALKAGGGCGTVGCAMGWMPAVFQKSFHYDSKFFPCSNSRRNNDDVSLKDEAEDFLGLTDVESEMLFYSDRYQFGKLPSDATPKQVAAHIRKFVRKKEKAK